MAGVSVAVRWQRFVNGDERQRGSLINKRGGGVAGGVAADRKRVRRVLAAGAVEVVIEAPSITYKRPTATPLVHV
jgi:hypothetical protein